MAYAESLVLLLIAFAALPFGRRMTGDWLSPPALVLGVWCGTLSLFTLRLLPYPPLGAETRLLLGGTVVLLAAGCALGTWLGARAATRNASSPHGNSVRGTVRPDIPTRASWWVCAYALAGLAGTVWYVGLVSTSLGWRYFLDRQFEIRMAIFNRQIPSQFLFLQYFCIVAIIVAVSLKTTGVKLTRTAWLGVFLCIGATWMTTDRTQFFTVVLVSYFIVLFARGRGLSFVRFLATTTVAVLLLLANFAVIGAWTGKTSVNTGLTMALPGSDAPPAAAPAPVPPPASAPPQAAAPSATPPAPVSPPTPATTPPPATPTPTPAPAATPAAATQAPPAAPVPLATRVRARLDAWLQRSTAFYLYATGSIAALDRLVAQPPPRTHGVHTFYPIARALGRAGLIAGPLPNAIPPPVLLGMTHGRDFWYNAFTFLSYPFEDFGTQGALIYALAVGLITGIVYGIARRRRDSAAWLLALAQISAGLVLSTFVNKFNNTGSWYILLCSLLPFATTALGRWSTERRGRSAVRPQMTTDAEL